MSHRSTINRDSGLLIDRIGSERPTTVGDLQTDDHKFSISRSMSEHMKDLEERLREKKFYRNPDRLASITLGDALSIVREYMEQQPKREWVSVEERLPNLGTPIFIRWGDEKSSPDVSNLKGSRIATNHVLSLMRTGKIGWWCERRVFVDAPPPFPQSQNQHAEVCKTEGVYQGGEQPNFTNKQS